MAKKRIRVTAALIERSGCFLVALRPLGGKRGGLWEFPGGKIRPGETPEACLKREIMEELGIGIKVLGFFDVCLRRGLAENQGVIIPRKNVENLVLRRRIREAVAEGRFHLFAIDRIEEGWPILTGMEAGTMGEDETFPEGTVYRKVVAQLDEFLREWSAMGEEEEKDKKEPGLGKP